MPYGSGSIYQRGKVWWISYMVRGEQVNESSKSGVRKDAEKLLKRRMGEIESGRAVGSIVITVPDLLTRLEADYVEKERRSLADLKRKIGAMKTEFKGVRAAEFGSEHIQRLKLSMKREKSSNGTVNRYLAILRRAFNLAERHDPPLVGRVPHFEMLPEDNIRQGFITDVQYRALLALLPDYVKGMLIFGYHLGMRKTALKGLRRDQVDFPARVIRAEQAAGRKKVGRILPIYGDMIPWLEMEMSCWPETPKCRWILHNAGASVGEFRKSWATACKGAEVPGLLFHDLRRSAVRNMIRAGLQQSTAMAITGHKTVSVFHRYAITSETDIKAAGEKLGRMIDTGREQEKPLAKKEIQ